MPKLITEHIIIMHDKCVTVSNVILSLFNKINVSCRHENRH